MARRGEGDGDKERFWRRVVRQWRRSEGTIRDFCDEHGLAEQSFYFWRRTIAERDREASRRPGRKRGSRAAGSPVFVPVHLASAAPASIASRPADHTLGGRASERSLGVGGEVGR
jgi:transposase-like protein